MLEFLKEKLTGKKDAATAAAANLTEELTGAAAKVADGAKEAMSPANGKVTVRPGDSLSKIAKAHNISLAQIKQANPQIKNPDLIHPGDTVNLG